VRNIYRYINIYIYIYPSRWFRKWVITLNSCSMNAQPNNWHRKTPPRVNSLIHKLGPYIGLISAPPLPHMAKSALIFYLSRLGLYGIIFLSPSGLTHAHGAGPWRAEYDAPYEAHSGDNLGQYWTSIGILLQCVPITLTVSTLRPADERFSNKL
jgi:hypothetical protein